MLFRVWCPKRKTMAHLNELPNSSIADSRLFIPSALPDAAEREALSFLGPVKPDDVNAAIAKGDINPMTHQPFRVQQVGDIVHVTSGDQVASPELKLTQAPRKTAPASLQPHMPHVSLGGHRKASLGVFQPGQFSYTGVDGSMIVATYSTLYDRVLLIIAQLNLECLRVDCFKICAKRYASWA